MFKNVLTCSCLVGHDRLVDEGFSEARQGAGHEALRRRGVHRVEGPGDPSPWRVRAVAMLQLLGSGA